jgi:hypothetical protein
MAKEAADSSLHQIPEDVMELLGRPSMLSTEDGKLYCATIAFFATSMRPDDLVLWFLIRDLADHRVEIARYRRMKTAWMERARAQWITNQINSIRGNLIDRTRRLKESAEQQKGAIAKSNKAHEEIEKNNTDIDTKLAADIAKVQAEAQPDIQYWRNLPPSDQHFVDAKSNWIKDVQTLDLLLNTAEERFSATLYEIERHLSGLGRLFREEARKLIDLKPAAPTSAGSATQQTGAGEAVKISTAQSERLAPTPAYSRKQGRRRHSRGSR